MAFNNWNSLFVGAEDLLSQVEGYIDRNTGYPAYNIIRNSDKQHVIELAVAGTRRGDITIEREDNTLIIRGRSYADPDVKEDPNSHPRYIHRGITSRKFERRFKLLPESQVGSAKLVNGILSIFIDTIEEKKKTVKIDIGE